MFPGVEPRGTVELVGDNVQPPVGAEAEGIGPGQARVLDQEAVAAFLVDDAHGVVADVGDVDVTGPVDGDAVADRFVAVALDALRQHRGIELGIEQVAHRNAVKARAMHRPEIQVFVARVERNGIDADARPQQGAVGAPDLYRPAVDGQIDVLGHHASVPFEHAPRITGGDVHDDERGVCAARRVGDIEGIVRLVDRQVIDETVRGRDRWRQVDHAAQAVAARVPGDEFRRDAAAHAVVEHPHHATAVALDTEHGVERDASVRAAGPGLVRERHERAVPTKLHDPPGWLVELVQAHDDPALGGDRDVAGRRVEACELLEPVVGMERRAGEEQESGAETGEVGHVIAPVTRFLGLLGRSRFYNTSSLRERSVDCPRPEFDGCQCFR